MAGVGGYRVPLWLFLVLAVAALLEAVLLGAVAHVVLWSDPAGPELAPACEPGIIVHPTRTP